MASTAPLLAPLPPGVPPVWWEHGRGSVVWDRDGHRYLDLTSGVLIANLGHSHPAVTAAIAAQADRLLTTFVGHHAGRERYAARLLAAADGGFTTVAFGSTGAEAVDIAVRAARAATGRRTVVSFLGGYHGKTTENMRLSGLASLQREVGGAAGQDVVHLPYPDRSTRPSPAADGQHVTRPGETRGTGPHEQDGWTDFLARLGVIAPEGIAAVLVEPYLGAGGGVVPDAGFLDRCRRLCDQLGARLIVDEVQAGFGRTGRLFAHQAMRRPPDLVVLAKGIANGVPMSAVLGHDGDLSAPGAGTLWSSYSANPLACAAALATLTSLEEEIDYQRTTRVGTQLVDRLRAGTDPDSVHVDGIGLSLGLRLTTAAGTPDPARAAAIVRLAATEHILLLPPAGPNGEVVRIAPPLTIDDTELEQATARVLKVIEAAPAGR